MYVVEAIGLVIIAGVIGAIALGIAFVAGLRVPDGSPRLGMVLAMAAAFGVIVAVVLARTGDWFDCHYLTDPNSITARGLLRSRSIAWHDIRSVTTKSRSGALAGSGAIVSLTLKTDQLKMVVSLYPTWAAMRASIWQHLRRCGKAEEDLLTPDARSLWLQIRASVPREMDWYNSHSPSWLPVIGGSTVLIALVVGAIVYRRYIDLGHVWNFASHFVYVLVPFMGKGIRDLTVTARNVMLREDRLEGANMLGKIDLPWSQLTRFHLTSTFLLVAGTGLRSVLVIPFKADEPEAMKLVLGIVRRLRETGYPKPIVIPEPLRTAAEPDVAVEAGDPAELLLDGRVIMRPVPAAMFAVVLVLGVVVPLMLLSPVLQWIFPGLAGYRIPIAIAWCLLTLFGMMKGVSIIYVADHEGITDRKLLGSRHVSWRKVASYEVEDSRLLKGMRSRVLKDSSGRTLFSFMVGSAGGPNDQRFAEYVDRMLESVRVRKSF